LSAYKDAAVYLVLISMLVVLPAGVFGKRQREKV
ncbi:MAG: branched-chain amino acid ABC transporter permease, partial [Lacticaseibacillus paracasei]|nr:branched-chain amino acid ABC transporter permease [Lacticaseibacillus paracasei]